MADEPLMEFPCEFSIKAMGLAQGNLHAHVLSIVRRHVDDLHENSTKSRPSRTGKYLSITVTIQARSQQQLDAIYQDLSDDERITMAL